MTTRVETDVIDQLAGIAPDSSAAALRRQKPDLVAFAQGSYDALLEPETPGEISHLDRHAIAYRVGVVTGFPTVAAWHRDRLKELGAYDDFITAVERFPDGGKLDPRLVTMLEYTDRVTRAPGTAERAHIDALRGAGLSPTAVVTLGQLVGFLGYQARAIAVARAFGAAS